MIYGYIRVSSKKQVEGNSLELQEKEILSIYPGAKIYREVYSGAKKRKVFENLIEIIKKDDILVVTKLDRFCRSTKEGLQYIDMLIDKGIKIHILNMGLIEDTTMGRLIVTNLLAFAEFERAMIVERTQSGKAAAKNKPGYKEGRPKKFNQKQIENALSMLSVNGGAYSYNEVSNLLNISKSTLIRAMRERRKCKNVDRLV